MFESAAGLREEFAELEQQLADPAVHADLAASRRIGRRYAELTPIVKNLAAHEQLTADLAAARDRGEKVVMLARARQEGGSWAFRVGPEALPLAHPLAGMPEGTAGILYDTDIQGRQACFTYGQEGPLGTAAGMLRDLLELG